MELAAIYSHKSDLGYTPVWCQPACEAVKQKHKGNVCTAKAVMKRRLAQCIASFCSDEEKEDDTADLVYRRFLVFWACFGMTAVESLGISFYASWHPIGYSAKWQILSTLDVLTEF